MKETHKKIKETVKAYKKDQIKSKKLNFKEYGEKFEYDKNNEVFLKEEFRDEINSYLKKNDQN